MLLARVFAYADAHRARMGVNYKQIPVNAPKAPVHSYSKDGAMRVNKVTDPVYAPNSYGGPAADRRATADGGTWSSDGEMVRAAYTLRRTTTTGARRARWSARCWTTPRASGWSATSSVICSTA